MPQEENVKVRRIACRHIKKTPTGTCTFGKRERLGSKITAEVQLLMKGWEMRTSPDTQLFTERE
jgi:hypothetical protein